MQRPLMELLKPLLDAITLNFLAVLRYPLTGSERLYWVYLLTSLAVAAGLWRRRGAGSRFREFLFPTAVWHAPSAWLDVRYFFFHQIFRVWIYGAFTMAAAGVVYGVVSELLVALLGPAQKVDASSLAIRAACMVAIAVLGDGIAWFTHLLQHRIPWLWEFHKIHHSAEVMHPLTNYREHPIDNFAYAIGNGLVYGSIAAVLFRGFDMQRVPVLSLFGLTWFGVMFNLLGYHLRHSHIWLAWPAPFGALLGSPAYHQIHHSRALEHRDTNFAFIFPVWDRLFGFQVMPTTTPMPIEYGLGDGTEPEYATVLGLYFLPFQKIWASLARRSRGQAPAAP